MARLEQLGQPKRKLEGRVAVIVGSTTGIGLATARRLGQDGAKVVVCSRKQTNVDRAVTQLRADDIEVIGTVCHVARPEDRAKLFQKTVEKFGGLDILISVAGVNPHLGPTFAIDEKKWDKIFDTNVKATFFLIKEAVELMKKRGGGSIVLMSSIAAYIQGPLMMAYGVSKTAVLALVKGLAEECAQYNIRVNGVAPGGISTNFVRNVVDEPLGGQQLMKDSYQRRFGTPEECAAPLAFLASDEASFITGETLIVAGGHKAARL